MINALLSSLWQADVKHVLSATHFKTEVESDIPVASLRTLETQFVTQRQHLPVRKGGKKRNSLSNKIQHSCEANLSPEV